MTTVPLNRDPVAHFQHSSSTLYWKPWVQKGEKKGIQIAKKEVKLSFANNMILYVENPKDSTQKV